MRVAWLTDQAGYIGGAEMTQEEFAKAAPEGVELVPMRYGAVEKGCDRYVFNNVVQCVAGDLEGLENVIWYHHDLSPHNRPQVKEWLDENASHIFCSEFQRKRYGLEGQVIPPPLDLDRFRPPRQVRRGKREGICSIAQWRGMGKGPNLLDEWAQANGPVDVYGDGEVRPRGHNIHYRGALAPEKVPQTLWSYEAFVFLPAEPEPFCRSVMEAHAAGCRVITNSLIGATEFLADPSPVENAAETFWKAVLS